MEKYSEAEPMFVESIEKSEHIYGVNHPEVADRLNNLGRLYRETKRPKLAQAVYERAIRIYETSVGEDLRGLATVHANYAFCLMDQELFTESEKSFRRALELDEKAYGKSHLEVATDMGNLGGLLMEMGRYAEADPLLRRSLRIIEQAVGKKSPIAIGAQRMLEDLNLRKRMFRSSLER
jgi:tetratricopeptide (TPR) repeat protein